MTTYNLPDELDTSAKNAIRVSLGLSGAVAVVAGIAMLVWPVKVAVVLAGIIAAYAIVAGLINIAIGVFARSVRGWARLGYLALGVAFLVAAGLSFANLQAAAAGLAVFLGILIGVMWIFEGIVSLSLLRDSASKLWTIVFAALSIFAGITVVSSPLWGTAILWLLAGISLLVTGLVQLVRAFLFGRRTA